MIPLEVGDGNIQENHGCDPKIEDSLGEYSHCFDEDNSDGPFLLKKRSNAKTKRTEASLSASEFRRCFRKHHVLVWIIVFVASVFLVAARWGRQRTPVLRFRLEDNNSNDRSRTAAFSSNQTFTIMQITDIHLGEAEYTDWGPEQDEKTFRLLNRIFEYEPDCDLIVLGGDQLTANNCLGNCTKYYEILGSFLSRYGVPWATVFGNHDDMDFEVEDGTGATIPHSYTRRDLLRVDQRFGLSLSQGSAEGEVAGVTNYVLDVLDPVTKEPALQVFFLDSGGGSMEEAIQRDQVRWFREQASKVAPARTSTAIASVLPAVAFQHIPTWQHEYVDGECTGYRGDGVAELQYDAGIVEAMVESGRFHFLAVGHNHGNDYCCSYSGDSNNHDDNIKENTNDLYFCFGRHSGYGGYGKWDRGVRMYELSLTTASDGTREDDFYNNKASDTEREFKWRTWVRLESGEKVDVLDYDHTTTTENGGGAV